jgi:hypothetical protein
VRRNRFWASSRSGFLGIEASSSVIESVAIFYSICLIQSDLVAVSLQQISRKLICVPMICGPFVLPSPLAKSFFAGALVDRLVATVDTRNTSALAGCKDTVWCGGRCCKGNQSAFSTGSVVNRIAVSLQLQTW